MLVRSTLAAILALSTAPALAQWATWPPGPTDADLEAAVRAAYVAAAGFARDHGNYFTRDGAFEPLRAAIAGAFPPGQQVQVIIAAEPFAQIDDATACAAEAVELRFASNALGDGISLVAASPSRVFVYRYDPHEGESIAVTPAADCRKG